MQLSDRAPAYHTQGPGAVGVDRMLGEPLGELLGTVSTSNASCTFLMVKDCGL